MVVDEATADGLRAADPRVVRIFAAGCAERLAPVFCVIRAAEPDRGDDVAFVVETLESLWDPQVPAGFFAERRARLLTFPELEPDELGWTEVADIYSFYGCLVLMYATRCAETGGDPEAAISAAHAALTAMEQLDSNVENATHFADERNRQAATLQELAKQTPPAAIRDTDRLVAQGVMADIVERINH